MTKQVEDFHVDKHSTAMTNVSAQVGSSCGVSDNNLVADNYREEEEEDQEFMKNNGEDDDGDDNNNTNKVTGKVPNRTICHLFALNAFPFAYGVLLATFGLITLPVESENLWPEKHALLLAIFLGLCGVSQLSGPIAGYFSDRCTHRMGKRRPFLLCSSLISIPSLFVMRWASLNHNLPAYISCFFLAMLALNVMYVAYNGALTDLVNEHQRGIANGIMGAFSIGGAAFGFACFWTFLTVEAGYFYYIVILSSSVLISLLSWTERPSPLYSIEGSLAPSPWTWKEIGEAYWVDPVQHRDFFLVFVSRTLYYMGTSVQAFMLFYFRDVIHSDEPQSDVAILALLGQLTGAIFCIPMGILSNRTGRKPLIYLSSTIIISSYVLFMFASTRQLVFWGGAIYGVGNGTYLAVDYALACDTIPSKEQTARYLGIWGVGSFIGTLFGPIFCGPALMIFGGSSVELNIGDIPHYEPFGYQIILLIGNICLLLGALTVIPIRPNSHIDTD